MNIFHDISLRFQRIVWRFRIKVQIRLKWLEQLSMASLTALGNRLLARVPNAQKLDVFR